MVNFHLRALTLAVSASLILTACGGDDNNTAASTNNSTAQGINGLSTGKLLSEPTTFKTLTKDELQLASQTIEPNSADAIGTPKCGVRVEYMHYDTVDAKGNPTDATGAVFVPTGDDPVCQGSRPVVLHAHGTAVQQNYNFAEVGNANNEAGARATAMANIFAGNGFIVIAPNYAGYDQSQLSYHPYLNATQQSHEMGDALKAGRTVLTKLTNTTVKDNGKLFLTGYSQGGHVALATAKYFEQINEPVTALMPMSGPYAMGAFGDTVFGGTVMVGGTYFAPLMARSYQEQFGNIYQTPSDIFAPANADEISTMLPTRLADAQTDLVLTRKLPALALFQSGTGIAEIDAISPADPKFAPFFSNTNYLLSTTYRANYLADMKTNPDWFVPYAQGQQNIIPVTANNPTHPLRKALKANDLRDFVPKAPTILCGGNQDPMVFFDVNTTLTNGLWTSLYGKTGGYQFGMVDLDVTNTATRTDKRYVTQGLPTVIQNAVQTEASNMQRKFAVDLATLSASGGTTAVLAKYHSRLAPYCMATARTFFQQF